jgi:hypothetical protein
MQRLTATIEQVVDRVIYTLELINSDTIKIPATKLDYHKIIMNMLKKEKH